MSKCTVYMHIKQPAYNSCMVEMQESQGKIWPCVRCLCHQMYMTRYNSTYMNTSFIHAGFVYDKLSFIITFNDKDISQ